MRVSHQTRLILQALIDAGERDTYGYELSQVSGLKPGTLYPVLHRLAAEGWLESQWEEIDERAQGRRRRRYYRLTREGERQARVNVAPQSQALRQLMPGWST